MKESYVTPELRFSTLWHSTDLRADKKAKRRSHIEDRAAILRSLASEYLTINQLAICVNLNRVLGKGYVMELLQKGHVEVKKNTQPLKYSATQRIGLVEAL